MKLDPKKVRFVPPFLDLGVFSVGLRFVGRENTVHLLETALTVEGNLLKVGLMGLEILFRRALAEWSALTVPYSRIEQARFVRFPVLRVAALVVAALPFPVAAALSAVNFETALIALVCAPVVTVPALYTAVRIPARYVIDCEKLGEQLKAKEARAEAKKNRPQKGKQKERDTMRAREATKRSRSSRRIGGINAR